MTIQIERNENGNCINFKGATQPVYWNNCLTAVAVGTDRINIQNDIRSAGTGQTYYEYFNVKVEDFSDNTGTAFTSASSAVNYINSVAQVVPSGGGGSQTLNETLGLGNTSSRGMSVGVATVTKLHVDPVGSGFTYSEDLVVQGNARVTGILSIGTSSIVLDPNAKTISGLEELKVGSTTIKNDTTGNITFVSNVNPTQTINVGIGTTVSVNTTGIITASSFVGDGSGLTGITLSVVTDVNTSNLTGISTDYLMVYDPSVPGFKFVNPKTYFGINNDANPSPDIVDYGTY